MCACSLVIKKKCLPFFSSAFLEAGAGAPCGGAGARRGERHGLIPVRGLPLTSQVLLHRCALPALYAIEQVGVHWAAAGGLHCALQPAQLGAGAAGGGEGGAEGVGVVARHDLNGGGGEPGGEPTALRLCQEGGVTLPLRRGEERGGRCRCCRRCLRRALHRRCCRCRGAGRGGKALALLLAPPLLHHPSIPEGSW